MKNYSWLNGNSGKFLKRGYLEGDETPEERIQTIADAAEKYLGIKGFSDKFIDYMAKGFYSLSSPIWSNFGKTRGLPISCYGTYIPDDMELILNKVSEVGTMSKVGGEPRATSETLGTGGLPYHLVVPRLVYITSLQFLIPL